MTFYNQVSLYYNIPCNIYICVCVIHNLLAHFLLDPGKHATEEAESSNIWFNLKQYTQ